MKISVEQLRFLCPILECLIEEIALLPDSILILKYTVGGTLDVLTSWVPVTLLKDLDGTPRSLLQFNSALTIAGFSELKDGSSSQPQLF